MEFTCRCIGGPTRPLLLAVATLHWPYKWHLEPCRYNKYAVTGETKLIEI